MAGLFILELTFKTTDSTLEDVKHLLQLIDLCFGAFALLHFIIESVIEALDLVTKGKGLVDRVLEGDLQSFCFDLIVSRVVVARLWL